MNWRHWGKLACQNGSDTTTGVAAEGDWAAIGHHQVWMHVGNMYGDAFQLWALIRQHIEIQIWYDGFSGPKQKQFNTASLPGLIWHTDMQCVKFHVYRIHIYIYVYINKCVCVQCVYSCSLQVLVVSFFVLLGTRRQACWDQLQKDVGPSQAWLPWTCGGPMSSHLRLGGAEELHLLIGGLH